MAKKLNLIKRKEGRNVLFYVPEKQYQELKELSEKLNITMSSILRSGLVREIRALRRKLREGRWLE